MPLQEIDFVFGEALGLPEFRDDRAARRADASGDPHAGWSAFPRAVHFVVVVQTLHRLVEIAHEAGAPQLAVGEDLETDRLLAIQHVEDAAILDRRELLVRERRILARLEQLDRSQQAADMIRAVASCHFLTLREISVTRL